VGHTEWDHVRVACRQRERLARQVEDDRALERPHDLVLVVDVQRCRLSGLHLYLDDRKLTRDTGGRAGRDNACKHLLQR
jgi:hypothetical protein